MDTRIPPHSIEGEMALIGSMLLNPRETIAKAMSCRIVPESFYDRRHQEIFETLIGVDPDRSDALTIAEAIKRQGKLDKVGGYAYLAELQDSAPVSGYVEHYAEIVTECHLSRRIIEKATLAIDKAYKCKEGAFLQASGLISEIEAIIPEPKYTIKDMISEQLEIDERIAAGERIGLPLPWQRANNITHGIPVPGVTPLAGRDGLGKSRLATYFAKHWVCDNNIPTLYFPIEDTGGRFLKNFAATIGQYDGFRLNHNPSQSYLTTHKDCMNRINNLPIYVHDMPSTVEEISAIIATHKRKYNIEAVVIDGWKDIILGGGDNQTEREGDAMAKLIVAAKRNRVGIVLVMHLRDIEDSKWISKREIRGNKQLTQSSRMSMMYQDSGFPSDMAATYGLIEGQHVVLDICKCSYGDITCVPLKPELERGRFVDVKREGYQ